MRRPPLPGRPSRDVRIALREWREPTAPDFQLQYQHRRCDRDIRAIWWRQLCEGHRTPARKAGDDFKVLKVAEESERGLLQHWAERFEAAE